MNDIVKKEKKGFISQLAKACDCQRSYLSQVLHTHVHLTKDQAFKASTFFRFSQVEREYLLLLIEKERSACIEYQSYLNLQMLNIQKNQKILSKKIKLESTENLSVEQAQTYYSSWHYSVLHVASSVEKLKSSDDYAISLQIPLKRVEKIMQEMAAWGLVEWELGQWKYSSPLNFHLSSSSVLTKVNHNNLQIKVASAPLIPDKNLNYSSVFSIDKKDLEKVREQILSLIDKQRKVISKSGTEELALFRCDLITLLE